MGVDWQREARHINRVRARDLTELWTAQSYRPEIITALSDIRRMERWQPLGDMCERPIIQGRTPTYAINGDGYPCLKTKHINGLVVDDSDPDRVTHKCAAALAKLKVTRSTILMNRSGAGSIGRCSIYLGDGAPLTNEHLLHIHIAPPHDPCFMVAYLSTWWGERAIEQGVTGSTGQLNLASDHVSRLPVPCPSPDAQKYIGEKVRQAERLLVRARSVVSEVLRVQQALVPPFRPSKGKWNTFRVSPERIRDVIVPHFYPPAVSEYLSGRSTEAVSVICHAVYSGETYPEAEGTGVNQATSRSCSGRFIRRPCNRVQVPTRGDLDLQPHDLLLTNAAHDKAYIGSDVTYFHGGGRNVPSTKVMVIRPNRERMAASYLYAYLHTDVGYLQIQSAIRGLSAGIRPEDIGTIQIPIPDVSSTEWEQWLANDLLMVQAAEADCIAADLALAATLFVTDLVEGRVAERDLAAAQQALETGDRSSDRALLQSLRLGSGAQATALFPDVDALYELLGAHRDRERED